MNINFNKYTPTFYAALLLLVGTSLVAQNPSVPTPGAAIADNVVLTGATIHVGNGDVIENGLIQIENGSIVSIGDAASTRLVGEADTSINVSGKHIYPGFIALNTTMGLVDIAAVRATRDYYETGTLNPNVRSVIAFNTDSRVIPTVRSNGVLMTQVTPQGGFVSGQSSVVQLDAWNWEDAIYTLDDGMHINWPRMFYYKGWWAEPGGIEDNEDYTDQLNDIKALMSEAKAYCKGSHSEENLKLEAMCRLFSGEQKMYVRVSYIKEIIDAVSLLKEFDIDVVIVGGSDAWMATDILKEYDVPVVINKTHNLPNRSHEDVDIAFRLPKILQDAGITYAITVGSGWDGFWDQRNLAFEAGTAAAYGLSKEEALASITLNAAKILGIDDKVGSLEVGKDATLLVSEGDVLDMRTSNIGMALIHGRLVDLDNKQKALYRKFMTKYGLTPKE